MGNLNLHESFRVRCFGAMRLCVSILLLGTLFTSVKLAQAAPVTFRFDATVADGTDLPFNVSQGDVIEGTISFESGSPGPIYPQFHGMRFGVAGMTLQADEFEIEVENDRQIWIDVPGRIADPDNAPDTDFNDIGDNIVVSCQGGGPLFCGSIEESSSFVFRPLLVLSDQETVLDSSDLSTDANFLNAFSQREMSIIFKNLGTGETTYVGAYIGQFQQVPEPTVSSNLIILICVLLPVFSRVRNSHAPLRKFRP
jgi:hypothetical protein